MKAKRNRYDLSLWDVRKLSLYGRARDASKPQLLVVVQVWPLHDFAILSAGSQE